MWLASFFGLHLNDSGHLFRESVLSFAGGGVTALLDDEYPDQQKRKHGDQPKRRHGFQKRL